MDADPKPRDSDPDNWSVSDAFTCFLRVFVHFLLLVLVSISSDNKLHEKLPFTTMYLCTTLKIKYFLRTFEGNQRVGSLSDGSR